MATDPIVDLTNRVSALEAKVVALQQLTAVNANNPDSLDTRIKALQTAVFDKNGGLQARALALQQAVYNVIKPELAALQAKGTGPGTDWTPLITAVIDAL